MARFDRQVATALRLIAKNGKRVEWHIPGSKVIADPLRPWDFTETEPVTESVVICFLPITKEMRESLAFLRGTELPIGSVMGLMGQVKFEPTGQHSVVDDGKRMDIDTVDVLAPNGQRILYTVVFKK